MLRDKEVLKQILTDAVKAFQSEFRAELTSGKVYDGDVIKNKLAMCHMVLNSSAIQIILPGEVGEEMPSVKPFILGCLNTYLHQVEYFSKCFDEVVQDRVLNNRFATTDKEIAEYKIRFLMCCRFNIKV